MRWHAVEALGYMGPEAASTVDAILPLLDHEDFLTRRWAVEALGRIGPPAKRAAGALAKAPAQDPDQTVRAAAEVALFQVDLVQEAATARLRTLSEVRELIDQLGAGDPVAAKALGEKGNEASDAVPALALALRQGKGSLREAAAEALGSLGRQAVRRAARFGSGRPRARSGSPRRGPKGPQTNRGPVTLQRQVHHGDTERERKSVRGLRPVRLHRCNATRALRMIRVLTPRRLSRPPHSRPAGS